MVKKNNEKINFFGTIYAKISCVSGDSGSPKETQKKNVEFSFNFITVEHKTCSPTLPAMACDPRPP